MSNGYQKSKHTPIKDEHFLELIKTHINIIAAIIKKHSWIEPIYHYWDLTAGPGVDDNNREGSPFTIIKQLMNVNLPYHIRLFEKDMKTKMSLYKNLCNKDFPETWEIWGDHNEELNETFLKWNKKARYGSLYVDPSGEIPPFELIGRFFNEPNHSYIDLMIHVAATNIKRCFKSPMVRNTKRLIDYI